MRNYAHLLRPPLSHRNNLLKVKIERNYVRNAAIHEKA